MNKIKELTDFYMWMQENGYDHNIRVRVEKKAELFLNSTNVGQKLPIRNVRRSFISRLLCLIGWHQFTCKMKDCIDEFGYVPNDGRMPKVAKCSRCGKNYA
jgi:hypothetical protein